MPLLTPAVTVANQCPRTAQSWPRPAQATAPPIHYYITYIQQTSCDTRLWTHRSLQELITYLKKKYTIVIKHFETSLTTIRRSRYDLDIITRTSPASRNLFISQSHDRAWESYPATYVHTPSRRLNARSRREQAAVRARWTGRRSLPSPTLTDIH